MKAFILPKFIDAATCQSISDWTLANLGSFRDSYLEGPTRKTTRNTAIVLPSSVTSVQPKISSYFNMPGSIGIPDINAIVVTVTNDGGTLPNHVDGIAGGDRIGLRCNLLVAEPTSGGAVNVEGEIYNLTQGDMMCYQVSEYQHSVETCHGNPRILVMYEWAVDLAWWQSIEALHA